MGSNQATFLCGRDDDIDALEHALDDTLAGSGRVRLVAGDSGMGKTRLARELSARAAARGTSVLWGGCSELDPALPFLPFNEAIGTYLAKTGADSVRAELGPLAAAVSAIVPQLVRQASHPRDVSDLGARLTLFEGVVAVLRTVALASSSGAVLVIDDMHWADEPTLELLDFVVRRIRDIPLLILSLIHI